MEKPDEPQLHQFGVSQDDLENHPDLNRWYLITAFITGAPIGLYLAWEKVVLKIHDISTLIVGGIITLMFLSLGLLVGGCVAASINYVSDSFLSSKSERYKKVKDYKRALKRYTYQLNKYNEFKKKSEETYWRSLSGIDFERALGNLYWRSGYDVDYTPITRDGGVDLILRKSGKTTIVQCKAHSSKIPIRVARELAASIIDFNADNAIIACFEGVTKPVTDYILDKPIKVVTLEEIIEMHIQAGI